MNRTVLFTLFGARKTPVGNLYTPSTSRVPPRWIRACQPNLGARRHAEYRASYDFLVRQTGAASGCGWRASHALSAARTRARVRLNESRVGGSVIPALKARALFRRRVRRTVFFWLSASKRFSTLFPPARLIAPSLRAPHSSRSHSAQAIRDKF